MKNTAYRYCITGIFGILLLFTLAVSAQKLPQIQQASIYAPENVKIDGKAIEWSNRFQAYNKANHLFYTIANDDQNLYLVIYTTDHQAINKIYVGGITFSIAPANSRNSAGRSSVTYPIIGRINNGIYLHAHVDYQKLAKDPSADRKSIITLIASKNKQFSDDYKELQVKGLKSIDESVISIYNTEGIKAKALFDNELHYTYELAIPLKYMEFISGNNAAKFKFNIKLNGHDREGKNPYPPSRIITGDSKAAMDLLYVDNPTNFGGECILAKK